MKIKFFPSKKVKLTVDSAACVKYGIVPEYFADRIVDTIYWTIRSNQLYKNDVMLLDLIATGCWDRPFYFAAPNSVNHCFALDSFCMVTGYVYKFMPVKATREEYIQGLGGIDAITSYEKLQQFKWGNLNDPDVYVDPESLNNSVRPKTNYLRTAQQMALLGKDKEAETMLDTYFTWFPESKFPFDMYMTPYADIYYQIGATDKANKIVERLLQVYRQDLSFYNSVVGSPRQYYDQDIQSTLGAIQNLVALTKRYNQEKLSADADSLFKMELNRFQ
jgi:hypothetical protein